MIPAFPTPTPSPTPAPAPVAAPPLQPLPPVQHVLIVGGGASGALMALHLLHEGGARMRVTVVERGALLGCGIAYATDDPCHLLNTRVAQMSAFPDDPDHFARWLDGRGHRGGATSFADRGTYGRYLSVLLAPWMASGRLLPLKGECLRLFETPRGVEAVLADGRVIRADRAILATGHAVPAQPVPPLRGAWDFRPPADPHHHVVIIGTGLSMVDHVATLLTRGHLGPIHCLSRRGLLPQDHAPTQPLPIGAGDLPLGAPVSRVMRWLRAQVRLAEAQGGTWRDAVDGLRPHVSTLWQAWPLPERARFLRHAAPWWEVHRHRMPPASAARLSRAMAEGQLRLHRARFLEAQARPDGRVEVRLAGSGAPMVADHVIDCRGIRRDPAKHAPAVVQNLLARGDARLDPLQLGLETTSDAQVLRADGAVAARLHAIGPAARGTFWEITAIPDIRSQTAALARRMTAPSKPPVPAVPGPA